MVRFQLAHTILDARILDFGCEKVLPVASLKNSNVALDKPKWYQ
jgi:hypothetical protein